MTQPSHARTAFSPLVMLWIVVVGAASFCAFLLLLAYAPELRQGQDGGHHALSRSAVGFAAAVALLRAEDMPVTVNQNPKRGADDGLLILTPDADATAKAIGAVMGDATTLIVLPKWRTEPDGAHRGWVRNAGLARPPVALLKALMDDPAQQVAVSRRTGTADPLALSGVDDDLPALQHLQLGAVDSLQTVSGADLIPVLVDDHGDAVLAHVADRDIYVLADPDLLNTHGLRDEATAETATAIIQALRDCDSVTFDVTLNGLTHDRNLLRTAFEPPFLAATLCAFAAALLMGLQAARRFGPVRATARAFELGKSGLAANSAALIGLARREPRMATPYVDLVRTLVAHGVGAPTRLSGSALDEFLDRTGQARGARHVFSEIAATAADTKTRSDLMRTVRALNEWKQDMLRERH